MRRAVMGPSCARLLAWLPALAACTGAAGPEPGHTGGQAPPADGSSADVDGAGGDGGHGPEADVQTTPESDGDAGGPCIVGLSVGVYHTCAVRRDGTLWCWGGNESGQSTGGPGDPIVPKPTHVAALGNGVIGAAAGYGFTCAWKTDRTAWCWGRTGQLGNGWKSGEGPDCDGGCTLAPVEVKALGNTVVQIAARGLSACARTIDGTVWCWGESLGPNPDAGATVPNLWPVQVPGLGTSVVDVATGGVHACARRSGSIPKESTLWCWGYNSYGSVSPGPKLNIWPPQQVGLGTDVRGVALGAAHTCAYTGEPSVWCWGLDAGGLVPGNKSVATPTKAPGIGPGVIQLAAGGTHSCALNQNGTLWCWGMGCGIPADAIPDASTCGPFTGVAYPVEIKSAGTDIAAVSARDFATCVIKRDGTLWCWGENGTGQLGVPSPTLIASPMKVPLDCP